MAIWTSLPSGSTGASRTAEGSCSTALPSKPSRWSQQLTSRSSGPRRRTGPETTTPWGYLSEIDTPLAVFYLRLRRTAILSYVISGVLSSGLYFYLLNLSSRWGRPESTIASRLVSPLTLLNFLIKYLIGSASRRGTHAAEFILLGGVAILVNRSDDCTGALESTAPIVDPGGPGLRLTGWAWDVKHQRPPLAIVVTTNGIITGIGAVGGWRPDVAAIQLKHREVT